MLARVWSASLVGIDAVKVGVEVDVAGGLPGIVVVGLPGTEVEEPGKRVASEVRLSVESLPLKGYCQLNRSKACLLRNCLIFKG
ncbi:MAG: hypothetical protein KME18_21705 [Phormidium tanganyikae FI6-MK23]|jgi:magnesium chelatase family protein|nr:hypothetical protein [Phormidium tanganyikae FI6-MK23]